MELQPFPLSKLYTDPIQRILVPWRFCLYDARRGFVRSSSCGSVILMHGIYRCKEDLSLLNCLAAINFEFVMECQKLTAHPMWYIHEKIGWDKYIVLKKRSMRFLPEWRWRARKYKIAPDSAVQCWNIFLFPPPLAMLFFHFSSDQWWFPCLVLTVTHRSDLSFSRLLE